MTFRGVKKWHLVLLSGSTRRRDSDSLHPMGGGDAFVHISEVQRSGMDRLTEGQRVIFTLREEAKGLKAVDLKPGE